MKTERLDKIIYIGLISVIAFTALAHGAVEAWSVTIFELLIVLLLFLWVIKSLIENRFELKIPPTALPMMAFLLLGLIQSISLTNSSGELISLSFDPQATQSTVKIFLFLLVAHILAANILKTQERMKKMVIFLTIFGFLLAIFGLLQYFTWNGQLYWLRPAVVTTKGVIGPFVNHNHFAGYMELIVPFPIALIVTGAVNRNRMLFGFAAAIMAIALASSLSRGGIISLFGGLVFLIILGINYNRRKFREDAQSSDITNGFNWTTFINFGGLALILGAIILGTFWIGSNPIIERLTKNNVVGGDEKAESFESSRGWIWRNSMTMFRMNLVSGVGLGAFETAYPKYSSDNNSLSQIVDRTHNDYLQVLTDTGLIGGAIAIWFILTVLFMVFRSLRSSDPYRGALGIGCGAAIF
ncbi:MAG TPA: O-antigen ligase family protein, partial [Pyrinomonadaceae bacterium]|nr:O-antigen ligase family protein [Pyrinomonadaceae bacterium]